MKLQVRTGLFETNSSSTHSLTMCMKEDWEAFKNGDKIYDKWDEKLIDLDNIDEDDEEDGRYVTYEDIDDDEYLEYFEDKFTTPSGETIIAFG